MYYRHNYRSSHEERIELGYLAKAVPHEVVRWLRANYKEPPKGIYGETLDLYKDDGRRLLEYVLSRRKDPLIDHGLARYGYSRYAIQKAFDRGDVSARAAALSNIRGGVALRQAHDILRTGKYSSVKAMLQNKFVGSSYIEALLSRKSNFTDISHDRLAVIVSAITRNERLRTPYKSVFIDGFDDYRYHLPFQAAWELTGTVPVNQGWASLLWDLLASTERSSIENVRLKIERWNIDAPPEKPGKWFSRSPSFFLRSLLHDFLQADQTLLEASDAAARHSFYRRFHPSEFRDWPRFLEMDGEEFTVAALQNKNLWSNAEQRSLLASVCWKTPDPNHNMDMPNDFRSNERRYKESHPEWFTGDPDEDGTSQEPFQQILERLDRLEATLQATPRKRGLFS